MSKIINSKRSGPISYITSSFCLRFSIATYTLWILVVVFIHVLVQRAKQLAFYSHSLTPYHNVSELEKNWIVLFPINYEIFSSSVHHSALESITQLYYITFLVPNCQFKLFYSSKQQLAVISTVLSIMMQEHTLL